MGAQLKPHNYSVTLLPVLISPVTDVNVTACYCFYVPSNDINRAAAASGEGDETTAEKKKNNLYSTLHFC